MEPIAKLRSYINSAIPYAWDDSESWFEFLAKLLAKVNELVEANNLNAITLQAFLNEYQTNLSDTVASQLETWVSKGHFDVIIDAVLTSRFYNYTEQMEEDLKDLYDKLMPPDYGIIRPQDYSGLSHNVDFTLWRDPADSKVKHDWSYTAVGYTNYYVDFMSGSSAKDGLTPETAKNGMEITIDAIEANPAVTHAKINIIGTVVHRDRARIRTTKPLNKKYIITSQIPIGANVDSLVWSADVGTTVKAPFTYPNAQVIRINEYNSDGYPVHYTLASSITNCRAVPNSYFIDADADLIYVNRADTSNLNTYVIIDTSTWSFALGASAELILDGIIFTSFWSGNAVSFTSITGTQGKVTLKDCKVICSHYNPTLVNATGNCIYMDAIANAKLFNVKVWGAPMDGFNYHNYKETGLGTIFEYDCVATNCGRNRTNFQNNLSTAHDGISIIRIGTRGYGAYGPLIADVNGCKSLIIDAIVENTNNLTVGGTNAAFYFSDDQTTDGKAWIINSVGGSDIEWGISCNTLFNDVDKINVKGFKGKNINPETIITRLE